MGSTKHILWNVFLAVIPVALAYILAWSLGTKTKRKLPRLVSVAIMLVWLVFLPNTCYLLTEWRHLLFDDRWEPLLQTAHEDPSAMLATAKWAIFFLAYSGLGVILFVLSIRPLEQRLRSHGRNCVILAPPLFFLTSLGVYLGLILRLNSWDLLHRPGFVFQAAIDALTRMSLISSILVFAALLWALYEAVDIWVEGVSDRMKRWFVR